MAFHRLKCRSSLEPAVRQIEDPLNDTENKESASACRNCLDLCFLTDGYRHFCKNTHNKGHFVYEIDAGATQSWSAKGCTWCSLLWRLGNRNRSIQDIIGQQGTVSLQVTLRCRPATKDLDGGVDVTVTPNGILSMSEKDFLVIFTTDHSKAASILPTRPIRKDFISDRSFKEIKGWLQSCREHENCRNQAIGGLPGRLIDVSLFGNESSNLKLITTDGGSTYDYAALSYTWGLNQSGVTTKANVSNRLAGFDERGLSQVVRDARLVTARLGIPYLWVDAVCIVQDDEKDKETEIAAMGDIYGRAILTISATNSESASDTFLVAKKPKFRERERRNQAIADEPVAIPFWVTDEILDSCFLQSRRICESILEPVHKRAWTLQETLLSPRILFYASHTIQFRCATSFCILGTKFHRNDGLKLPLTMKLVNAAKHKDKQVLYEDAAKAWMEVCQYYSQRQISFIKDRLTALGGIAETFSQYLGHQYLAGLWAGPALIYLLYWMPETSFEPYDIGEDYVAPSWSWASYGGKAFWDTIDDEWSQTKPLAQTVSYAVGLHSTSLPFARVVDGSLTLKGGVIAGSYQAKRFIGHSNGARAAHRSIVMELSSPCSDGTSIGLLSLFERPHFTGDDSQQRKEICGLVLRKCETDTSSNQYLRIGSFTSDPILLDGRQEMVLVLV